MTRFAYKAIPAGAGVAGAAAAGVVAGRLEAADETSVRESLRKQGLIPVEVRPLSAIDAMRGLFRRRGAKRAETVWFFQNLRRLLDGKAPIETAISTLRELAPTPRIAQACGDVREALRGGASLADAVEKVPGLAGPQHLALLRVGHESGRLRHAVELIDKSIETQRRLRKTIASRLVYPVILLTAALGAVWFLSTFVIPRFAGALEATGATLPMSTRVTLVAAKWLVWILPPAIALLAVLLATRSIALPPEARRRLDRWSLGWPVVGPLRWHAQAGMAADTLATMIEGGGDVLAGLEQSERALGSEVLRERLRLARRDVREGADLGEALERHGVLPPMPATIVRVGMKSGDLVGSLRRASDLCAERQEETTGRLLTLMEPGIILLLAGVVGWVIYSLVSGMLTINDVGGL